MAFGPVLVQGRGLAGFIGAAVRGHPPTLVEDLHGGDGGAQLDLLTHQDIGDTIVVTVELDVVIDVDAGNLYSENSLTTRFSASRVLSSSIESECLTIILARVTTSADKRFLKSPEIGGNGPGTFILFKCALSASHHSTKRRTMERTSSSDHGTSFAELISFTKRDVGDFLQIQSRSVLCSLVQGIARRRTYFMSTATGSILAGWGRSRKACW